MERRTSFYKDFLPFMVLVANECSTTGIATLFKAATRQGMSTHVFVAYAFVVATIVLLPLTIFSSRSRVLPPLTVSVLSKIALLALIGCSAQISSFAGIRYSSPTLNSAIGNLTPAFTFLLAVIFRMEKIAVKSRSNQAKVVGCIISIAGALVVTFYKGPPIIIAYAPAFFPLQQPISVHNSVDRNWAIGSLLLTAAHILHSVWLIVLVHILKEYADELIIVSFYNFSAAIMATIVGLFAEKNPYAWKIRLDITLTSIVCSGILGKFLCSAIYAWGSHLKGPVYVAMFKPLSIIIAVAMGVCFLGDTLHIGSILGGTIISIGFYTVMWGKATQEKEEDVVGLESPTTENVPFLQSYNTENPEKKICANA